MSSGVFCPAPGNDYRFIDRRAIIFVTVVDLGAIAIRLQWASCHRDRARQGTRCRKQMEQRAAETEKPPEVEAELPWSPVSPPAAAEAPAIQKPRKAKNSPPEDVHSAPPLVAKAPVATAAAAPALEEAGDSNFEVTKRRCKLCLSRPRWKFQCLRPLCCRPWAPWPRPRYRRRLRHLCRSSCPRQRRLARAPKASTMFRSGSI